MQTTHRAKSCFRALVPRNSHERPIHPAALFIIAVVCNLSLGAQAGQVDLFGPAGSGQFGSTVTLLPNGNFVVTDPYYQAPGRIADVGAVYLYNGVTLAQITKLTGSNVGDRVGDSGVIVLSNGNFLVNSTNWHNGAGAVTWVSGSIGKTGVVSAANSLVEIGTNSDFGIHPYVVTVLSNDNYIVSSPDWNNFVGAVTWGSGTSGVTGVVSVANSLVGSTAFDLVGYAVTVLSNDKYVVSSPSWNNGTGAATWSSGMSGMTGPVSAANSLIGGGFADSVGLGGVTALNNGNYVVSSPAWYNGEVANAGAVTWCNGTTGKIGLVSTANSLVGTTAGDQVGGGVTPLSNGNYVVRSPSWHNGGAANAGAVTWCNGTTGRIGVVSATNSIVGSHANDGVGLVIALKNGNYVVASPFWNNGAVSAAGAVTWGSGTIGTTGVVSAVNSLVGSKAGDQVGWVDAVTPLDNGNYVVISQFWDNGGVTDAGAVTWGNGTGGVTGVVSAANSLVGSTANDRVGSFGVWLLSNGNYIVPTELWDNGAMADAGAVTWGSSTNGVTGVISPANSLVGTNAGDNVGASVAPLSNGNYVVASPRWRNGAVTNAGAVTWGNGLTGTTGAVSVANSLVGTTANDYVGSQNGFQLTVDALSNGNYVVRSVNWHNGSTANAGAATWGNGTTGTTGVVSPANSLVGATAGDFVGAFLTPMLNGNYVVGSPNWHNGASASAGAATWAGGNTGRTGVVSSNNSLVGTSANDQVGFVIPLSDGSYLANTPLWDNGIITDAGAVTWCDGTVGTTGAVATVRSFLGTVASGGRALVLTNDSIYTRLLIGYPADNKVSLFGFTPRLVVQQPTNVDLPNGITRVFGAPVGANVSLTFTIKNANIGDLTGIGITIDGTDAPLFTVTSSPATIVNGPFGSTTFTVQFSPTSDGAKTAALHIASNDAAQNPFTINLSGAVLSLNQDTDGDGISDAAEFALASLGFDWQVNQSNLVNAYYSNANSAGLYTSNQLQALSIDSPLLTKDPQTGLFTLTIGVEKSTNLFDYVSFPMIAPQTTINGEGKLEFQFNSTDNAAFFRLESR